MIPTLITIALATVWTPAPVDANYAFIVPVRIENMTHMTSAMVSCSVVHDAPGLTNPISLGQPGTGTTTVPVRDGNFTGNITVNVYITTERLAAYTPTGWGCGISYRWRNPDGTEYTTSVRPGEREGIYTRLTGQEITTATVNVNGTLPPG
jgi:hypothetical protein